MSANSREGREVTQWGLWKAGGTRHEDGGGQGRAALHPANGYEAGRQALSLIPKKSYKLEFACDSSQFLNVGN